MKTIIISIILLLNINSNCFAQEDIIYIELNNDFKIVQSNDNKEILQSYLFLRKTNSFDIFYFNIFTEFKNFDGSETILNHNKFLTLDNIGYKKLNPCELHEFFSSNNKVFFLFYKKDDKFYGWNMLYVGTSKNTIVSIQKTKI